MMGSELHFGMIEIMLMAMLTMVPTILALVSILKNEFPNNQKLIWLLVVFLFPLLGAILYFVIGRKERLLE